MAQPSSLSIAARALRTHLAGATGLPEDRILIGHASAAVKDIESDPNKQFLNLFFYRVEHGAHPADGSSEDPFYLRFFCLITALGAKESVNGATISAGENDLRLVGSVMQGLHENPILVLQDEAGADVAQMQILLHVLSLDDLNHIWSTQGDTPYRLSVGYELALLPLPLARAAMRGPRIGSIGLQVHADARPQPLPPAGFGADARAPEVPAVQVDSSRPDWVPHICWLAAGDTLQYTMAFDAGALPPNVQVITLGAPGVLLSLEWERWEDPDATAPQWGGAAAAPPALVAQTERLDPAQSDPTFSSLARDLGFPLAGRGQAVLYARREYTRPDGAVVALRSNPLLVSVHAAA
jgi:hypothetical protein